jgi:hypothetical protein
MNIIEKIKLLFKLNTVVETEIKEIKTMDIKSGWKTSEFWGKVALQAGMVWGAVGGFVPPKYAAIVVAVAEGAYAGIRLVLKVVQLVQAAKTTDTAPAATPDQSAH